MGIVARQPEGVILVAVLWIVLLLALLASMLLTGVRQDSRSRDRAIERGIAEAVVDAGIKLGILALVEPRAGHWTFDGRDHEIRFQGRVVWVSIQDEGGKIDLNASQADYLERFFLAHGVSSEQARALVDAIADWRDVDILRRLNGAELSDYRGFGMAYGPRNNEIPVLTELLLVRGMTQDLFRRIQRAITIYSRLALPDLQTAPVAALRAVPGMDESKALDYANKRNLPISAPLQPSDTPAIWGMGETSQIGRAFTIRAEVELEGGARFRKAAVIRLTGDARHPYWVHAWQ